MKQALLVGLIAIACVGMRTSASAQDVGGLIIPRDTLRYYPFVELTTIGYVWISSAYGTIVGKLDNIYNSQSPDYESGRHFILTAGLQIYFHNVLSGVFDVGYASTYYSAHDDNPYNTFTAQSIALSMCVNAITSRKDPIAFEGGLGFSFFNEPYGAQLFPRVDGALRFQFAKEAAAAWLGVSYMNNAILVRGSLGVAI